MPFRAAITSDGLTNPDHVVVFDDSGAPAAGGVEIRLEDYSEEDPAGRYRLKVVGDVFTLERATAAGWASSQVLLRINGSQLELEIPATAINFSDDSLEDLVTLLLMHLAAKSPTGLLLRDLVATALL